jgi:hypothetical protein
MKNNLFSFNQFYIQFKAPNADELISYVMNKEEEYIEMPWAKKCKLKTIDCPCQEIKELIEPSINLFGDTLGKPFRYQYGDGWINCYERDFFQEIHDHADHADFSSVFFPQDQEDNFGKFYFFDRHNNSLNAKWKQIFDTLTPLWEPYVSAGDIIFFPSNVLHAVSLHRSDKVRKTLSFNYQFQ